MSYTAIHSEMPPTRDAVDQLRGAAVLEFGTPWCGYCRGAQQLIEQALQDLPQVEHIKVEDGPGRPLGRSYRVKLWPTLVFLKDGQEVARVVRPQTAQELDDALAQLDA